MNWLGGLLIIAATLFTVFALTPLVDSFSFTNKKIARFGVFASLAIALGIAESFLPDFLLPGMKIGLPNLAILILLYLNGFFPALVVSLVRVVVVTLLRGSFLAMGGWMSLAGALASILAMAIIKKAFKSATPVGVSLIGSVFHVSAQIAVAVAYVGTAAILYYLPFMGLLAIVSGLAVGLVDARILKILSRIGN